MAEAPQHPYHARCPGFVLAGGLPNWLTPVPARRGGGDQDLADAGGLIRDLNPQGLAMFGWRCKVSGGGKTFTVDGNPSFRIEVIVDIIGFEKARHGWRSGGAPRTHRSNRPARPARSGPNSKADPRASTALATCEPHRSVK